MPAHLNIHNWSVTPRADDPDQADSIFISGNVEDDTVKGEQPYMEVRISRAQLDEMPTDEAGRLNAVLQKVQQEVDQFHFEWMKKRATAPPKPVAMPLADVAAMLGQPEGGPPQITVAETHVDRGADPRADKDALARRTGAELLGITGPGTRKREADVAAGRAVGTPAGDRQPGSGQNSASGPASAMNGPATGARNPAGSAVAGQPLPDNTAAGGPPNADRTAAREKP